MVKFSVVFILIGSLTLLVLLSFTPGEKIWGKCILYLIFTLTFYVWLRNNGWSRNRYQVRDLKLVFCSPPLILEHYSSFCPLFKGGYLWLDIKIWEHFYTLFGTAESKKKGVNRMYSRGGRQRGSKGKKENGSK